MYNKLAQLQTFLRKQIVGSYLKTTNNEL